MARNLYFHSEMAACSPYSPIEEIIKLSTHVSDEEVILMYKRLPSGKGDSSHETSKRTSRLIFSFPP